MKVQEVICNELNLPVINLPSSGQAISQAQTGSSLSNAETPDNQTRENGTGSDSAAGLPRATEAAKQPQTFSDSSSVLYHYRDMQRRQVEFIKRRVLLLEKGLHAEEVNEYLVNHYI